MGNVIKLPLDDTLAQPDTAEIDQTSSKSRETSTEVYNLDTQRQLRRLDLTSRVNTPEQQAEIMREREGAEASRVAVSNAATGVVRMRLGVSAAGGKIPEVSSRKAA